MNVLFAACVVLALALSAFVVTQSVIENRVLSTTLFHCNCEGRSHATVAPERS